MESLHLDIVCAPLLRELLHLWNEIGESQLDKDRMLLEIEKECLGVYRRRVDEATHVKARLHQSLAAKEAELAALMAAICDLNIQSQPDKKSASLKTQLALVTPFLEDLREKKEERIRQFTDLKAQIEKISGEIDGCFDQNGNVTSSVRIEEHDLSLRKLNEYQTYLRSLQKEKSDRLHKVLECTNEVHRLCAILGLDFGKTVSEIHPSLDEAGSGQNKNISNNTLVGLSQCIEKLQLEKKSRVQKLKDVSSSLVRLWSLLDSPEEERREFERIAYVVGAAEFEIADPGILFLEMIDKVKDEVERLGELKAGRMKELVLKRRLELEDICRNAHIEPDISTAPEKSVALIDAGIVDPSELLANIEAQIVKAKEEASSRKDIMDRIDKWVAACGEEKWLEDYDQDDNRYNAGRGSHLNLKRAERARVTLTRIPGMVENLMNRAFAWEDERGKEFLYDGTRLITVLDEYLFTRHQKEEAKKRYRDQKKLQDLLLTEKESIYGSKPSPKKSNSFKKPNGVHLNGSSTPTPRRLSSSSATPELLTPRSYSSRQNSFFRDSRRMTTTPLNFVALGKEDTMSVASMCPSEIESPSPN